jgi:outer membrane protein assembly factor BamB
LSALDAATGSLLWTTNPGTDTGAKVPEWGFSSSPLVVNDLVIVAASGRLAAYEANTGKPRWLGPASGSSYSSPHLLTIGGVEQVVLLTTDGAISVAPADGQVLWKHAWSGFTALQPALTGDGGVLITTASASGGIGTRRLSIAHRPDGWVAQEVWTSIGLKPYFNDFVVHGGHAYGFDGGILSCIDLKDGKRKWKGGRYGHGQLILLTDQSLLVVIAEEGDLALVSATPDQFTEVTRTPALHSKTWNHPVLAGDILLVRNDEEMAAFRLARAE